MKIEKRAPFLGLALALVFGLIAGCNSLIGAGAPTLVDSLGGAGGTEASGGAAGGERSCLLASECPGAQICLFRLCSKQCEADKDCLVGRCLQTSAGSACVVPASAACTANDECPTGSVCRARACRSSCDSGTTCLSDQRCVDGTCVGNDTAHDPFATGGTAGDIGEGGASGSGAGDAGAENGGTAGSSGTAGGSGGSSGGGTAGSSGAGGSGGMSDGTATGSLGAPCDKNGALACAGHAQRTELICQNGTWQSNGTCSGNTLCDTTPGSNAGSCQPVISECTGQVPGFRFCRGTETEVRECGADRVTAAVVDSCTFVCSSGACAGACHPNAKQCKAGGVVPQICLDTGVWKDEADCAYQCDAATGKCIAAVCRDNVKNGDETDKDCGGSCGGCLVGGKCLANTDCVAPASAHCSNGTCVDATCADGVQNKDETDKDCGGGCPLACLVTQHCIGNIDCALPASGHCSGNLCVAATCTDGVKNGNETGKDCGGSCAADCPLGDPCGGDNDCSSGACLSGKCVPCKEPAKRCTNTSVQTCTPSGDWSNAVACTVSNGTPSCSAGVCGIAACAAGFGDCDNMIGTGCEANLNVPTACGTTCSNRIACSTNHGAPSCASGACVMACLDGYGDCSNAANDGCEKVLNSVTSCGTCGNVSTCMAPAQRCEANACAPNNPYPVGQAIATPTPPWSEFTIPNDTWFVVRVIAPRTATVLGLRVLGGSATPGGGLARMALWADDGSGHPGAFVAQTANILVAAGVNSGAPTPAVTQVTGGKAYWVGAKFTGNVRVYQNVTMASGQAGYSYGQAFGVLPSTLSPFPFGSATPFSDVAFNLFLNVQDIPP